jgi:hypothetical protein
MNVVFSKPVSVSKVSSSGVVLALAVLVGCSRAAEASIAMVENNGRVVIGLLFL